MKFDRLRLALWDASYQAPIHHDTLVEYQYAFTNTFDLSLDEDAVAALSLLYMTKSFVREAVLYTPKGGEHDALDVVRKEIDAAVSTIHAATLSRSDRTELSMSA